jgi:hypothetical protein
MKCGFAVWRDGGEGFEGLIRPTSRIFFWRFRGVLALLLLLALPAAVQAQFNYITNSGTITIMGYTGPGGAVIVPSAINGLPVTSIGEDAFFSCISLTSLTIPDSVTSIGEEAFYNCTSLTNVTIGNAVTSIGLYAFESCVSLAAIAVGALNPVYSSVDGVLLNKGQTTLIRVPEGKVGAFTIPNSVTSIGFAAFESCTGLTSVTIGNGVTSIGRQAFWSCTSLTSLTIPDSVTSIGAEAFEKCTSLTNVTIPDSVNSIEWAAFYSCTSLTSLTIPDSVTSIGDGAFYNCTSLTGVYFQGNAPNLGSGEPAVFGSDNSATVYYLSGTSGWGPTYGGRPTALWWMPPNIRGSGLTQTTEAGSAVGLWLKAIGSYPLFYQWYLNDTNLLSYNTNYDLQLTNLQFSQSGAYTVVVTNVLAAATSAPVMLQVIAAVERRTLPALTLIGQPGGSLNLDFTAAVGPTSRWTTFDSVLLTQASQWYFDLTAPLASQRFYRVWQTGRPSEIPSLDLFKVPAITLAGNTGDKLRLDYINRFGPIDDWVTLDTVTLTNTSQLYFDVSAVGQPPRLWRIVPVP